MKTRIAAIAVAAAAAALAPLGAARAAEHTVEATNFLYVPPVVVVQEGDTLIFKNNDSAPHNVVSYDRRPGGGRMFMSATVRAADGPTPVVGVETTPVGAYAFFCSIHPQMNGALVVAPAS